ncbi:MAG: hypothetical protein JSV04_04395, partial [Candidatus Heimdallarchaeota archaeon]
ISCKKNYLCEIGVTRGYNRGKEEYSCNYCGRPLIQEEVDKSIIEKKSGLTKSVETDDLYQKLRGVEKKGKKRRWQRTTEKTPALTMFERSQISELGDVLGLDVPLILEISKEFQINKMEKQFKGTSKKELLSKFAHADPKFIPYLYSSLIKLAPDSRSFKLRFSVFWASRLPRENKIELPLPAIKNAPDIKITDSTGKETWIYCTTEDLDINNLEAFAERVFSVDFNPSKVTQIFLVAKSFSYLAQGLIMKYQSVLAGIDESPAEDSSKLWNSIPLVIWQEVPGKLEFQNVSLD